MQWNFLLKGGVHFLSPRAPSGSTVFLTYVWTAGLPEHGENKDGTDEGDEGGGVARRVHLLEGREVRCLEKKKKEQSGRLSSISLSGKVEKLISSSNLALDAVWLDTNSNYAKSGASS